MKKQLLIAFTALTGMAIGQSLMADYDACLRECQSYNTAYFNCPTELGGNKTEKQKQCEYLALRAITTCQDDCKKRQVAITDTDSTDTETDTPDSR